MDTIVNQRQTDNRSFKIQVTMVDRIQSWHDSLF